MGCIIEPLISELEKTSFGVPYFWVNGVKYKNSAVSFWSALLREINYRFPFAQRVVINSCPVTRLDSSLLRPGKVDVSYLNNYSINEIRQQYEQVLVEMELWGEPSPVYLEISDQHKKKVINTHIALNVVDSEVFPLLLVWLLYWAGLDENCWNDSSLEGKCNTFMVVRKHERPFLSFSFELNKEFLSEGLVKWLLTIFSYR